MHDAGHGSVPTVCIGGINTENTAAVLAQSSAAPKKSLDGVAVVSAIVAAEDPAAAARDISGKVAVAGIPLAIDAVARTTPLSHNMTNLVRSPLPLSLSLSTSLPFLA
jgi:thiamine-phosphate diphosphorylase/hydroxyethylthiazole kinase